MVVNTGIGGDQCQAVVTGGIDGSGGSVLRRMHMPGADGGGLGVRSRVVIAASALQPERGCRRRVAFPL